jgi:hypothetical protein
MERHSRFVALVKLPSKDTTAVVAALSRHVRKLPVSLRRSLTWDRGLEMAKHKSFTVATNVKVYFCDPQSPWQRGSNENTNGLLRQYFPKRTDLSGYTQADLDKVALRKVDLEQVLDRLIETIPFLRSWLRKWTIFNKMNIVAASCGTNHDGRIPGLQRWKTLVIGVLI